MIAGSLSITFDLFSFAFAFLFHEDTILSLLFLLLLFGMSFYSLIDGVRYTKLVGGSALLLPIRVAFSCLQMLYGSCSNRCHLFCFIVPDWPHYSVSLYKKLPTCLCLCSYFLIPSWTRCCFVSFWSVVFAPISGS